MSSPVEENRPECPGAGAPPPASPRASAVRASSWSARVAQFLLLVGRAAYRFVLDGCGTLAGSLAFTTLLAIVPLLAVTFTLVSSVEGLSPLRAELDNFIFTLLVPEVGQPVRDALHGFVDKATGMGLVGYFFLTLTVLLLMLEVDTALLRIWGPSRFGRRLRNVAIIAVVVLGVPLLVAASLGMLSWLVKLPLLATWHETPVLYRWVLLTLPFGTVFTVLLTVYWLIPQWPVPFRHAARGALVATMLFEVSRSVFTWYVHHAFVQPRVYGAFAAIPFALVWVYTCWAILLYGAQLTHLMSVPDSPRMQWWRPVPATQPGDGSRSTSK
jgi:membrane protein